ncbi:alpha-galactosidase [uncultured Leifsonia sp.]|uniref:alpha-galactosidase n=1 Tax=uncultured Leifsonia sp. TaxID=340359 RepID=UPI0026009738|nr:alpha-galactosidase [uncultured Leifsonia sp.]
MFRLRAAGVEVLLDARGSALPRILHWGADLGAVADVEALADTLVPAVPPSSIDLPLQPTLVPVRADGWTGRPGVAGSDSHGTATPAFRHSAVEELDDAALTVHAVDDRLGLRIAVDLRVDPAGVVQAAMTLRNEGDSVWELGALAVSLPVPAHATEVLDTGGRWAGERQPQRRALDQGAWVRQGRHGRTGHDAPIVLAAGTPGFGFRDGDVWAVHLGFSGDSDVSAEATSTGHRMLQAGELLQPGEVRLGPGESYTTPTVFAAHSAHGLDGVSERFHAVARGFGRSDREPLVVLNTWEAVYFDHDLDTLTRLAERAASVGVERFVLDDGWMEGRVDDKRALGDWTVDGERWPRGLGPMAEAVTGLGMEFGLWIEPEMVSLDSQLARRHPEWLLTDRNGDLPIAWRHQHVLDLDHPEAHAEVLAQLDELLREYPIRFVKWDQNRDQLAGSPHRQVLATYRLMAELRQRHPDVVIESCSSGGGRVDFGVLRYAGRVWASDTNDPVDRHRIQRWTSVLVPPELIGSHVGAPVAHITRRQTALESRLATAALASAGIEWDLGAASEDDLATIAEWIRWYKNVRGVIATGTTVRVDSVDGNVETIGIVDTGRRRAVFQAFCVDTVRTALPAPFRMDGLDDDAGYRVTVLRFATTRRFVTDVLPPWLSVPPTVGGSVLRTIGLPLPPMNIGDVVTVELEAIAP